jgi:hypothetical protein
MARAQPIKILRTLRSALITEAGSSNLLVGEPYLITDENKLAIGTSVNSYMEVLSSVSPSFTAGISGKGDGTNPIADFKNASSSSVITIDNTGIMSILDSTDSTSTTTGALKVSGGLGVTKNITVGGCIKETVYTITDAAAFELNPNNGAIQLITLGANRAPGATYFASGHSMTLMIDDGTAYTITSWPTITWVGGTAPTLALTGYTVISFWKVNTTLYGALLGYVA